MLAALSRVADADAGRRRQAVAEIDWVMQFILGVRRIKGEMNIPPGKPLPVLLANASEQDRALARPPPGPIWTSSPAPNPSTVLDDERRRPESAIALVGEMKVLIPMAGLIDKDAELKRLDKEIARLNDDVARTEAKLANPAFVDKAPAAVVQKERDKLADTPAAIGNLKTQRERIAAL